MADIIGQETWSADGKAYVIKVTEPGATVTENAISIVSPIRLRKGDINYEALEPHLESQINFTVRDNSKLFSDALLGKQIGDIVLEFTEDGSTIFKGYVVPEFQRSLIYKSNPSFRVSAYDGVAGLKGIDYDQGGNQTVREQIYNIANKIGLSLVTNIFFEDKEDGADASTEAPDALRLRMESLLDGGTYYDALITLCEYYNAQFFQRNGEWFFMQRSLRGADMTKHVVNANGTSGTKATVDYIYKADTTLLHRETSFSSVWPAKSRIESVHTYVETGLRNGDFSQGARHWSDSNSEEVATGRKLDETSESLEQEVGLTFRQTTVTNRDRVNLTFNFSVEIDGAATGAGDIEYGIFKFIDLAGNERWLDATGGWNSTETTLKYNIADLATASSNPTTVYDGSFTSADFPFDPMGGTLKLIFEPLIGANAWVTSITHVEYQITHLRPEDDEEPPRPTEQVFGLETGELGDIESHEFIIGDGNDDHIAPGVMEYFDGTDWLKTTDWDGSGQSYHELRMTSRHDQLKQRLRTIEVSHKFGEDIDLHQGVAFDLENQGAGQVYIPTFVEKTYSRNAKIHSRSAGKELLGALVSIPVAPTHIFWGDSDGDIKKAPINTTSYPWTPETITSITSGREFRNGAVDQSNGYIFTLEVNTTSNLNYLMRRNLDGSNLTELLQWDTSGTDPQGWAMSLQRIAERVAVVVLQSPTSGNNYEVKTYEYDGTADGTIISQGGRTAGQAIAFDETETYMVLADVLGSSKKILRVTVSDGTDFEIYSDFNQDGSGEDSRFVIDTTEGKVWFTGPDGSNVKTTHYPFPGSGSETVWKTNTDGINAWGLAIDRSRGRIFYPTTTNGDIAWDTYAETDEQTVFDPGVGSHPDIEWICTGFN